MARCLPRAVALAPATQIHKYLHNVCGNVLSVLYKRIEEEAKRLRTILGVKESLHPLRQLVQLPQWQYAGVARWGGREQVVIGVIAHLLYVQIKESHIHQQHHLHHHHISTHVSNIYSKKAPIIIHCFLFPISGLLL